MDPRRKSTATETPGKRPNPQHRRPLVPPRREEAHDLLPLPSIEPRSPTRQQHRAARRTDAALESFARQLLARYGVLFRDLLTRESNAPKWRDLLNILRRLEARGEIRGGRFVSGFGGEQYALPEAVESLRASRSRDCSTIITVSAADPTEPRRHRASRAIASPPSPASQVLYRNGSLHTAETHEQVTEPDENLAVAIHPTTPTAGLPLF